MNVRSIPKTTGSVSPKSPCQSPDHNNQQGDAVSSRVTLCTCVLHITPSNNTIEKREIAVIILLPLSVSCLIVCLLAGSLDFFLFLLLSHSLYRTLSLRALSLLLSPLLSFSLSLRPSLFSPFLLLSVLLSIFISLYPFILISLFLFHCPSLLVSFIPCAVITTAQDLYQTQICHSRICYEPIVLDYTLVKQCHVTSLCHVLESDPSSNKSIRSPFKSPTALISTRQAHVEINELTCYSRVIHLF